MILISLVQTARAVAGLLLVAGAVSSAAVTAQPAAPLEPDGEPTGADRVHERVSEAVLAAGTWLDSFFEDERYTAEVNRSRLKAETSVFLDTEERPDLDLSFSGRLSVPNTERRLSLLLGGVVDKEDDDPGLVTDDDPEENDQLLAAGAQYFLTQRLRRNLSVQSLVRLSGGRPVLSFGPRYRETVPLGEVWTLRLTNTLSYFTDDGWFWRGNLDLERPVGDHALLRFSPGATWRDIESGVEYQANIRLLASLSPRRAIEYQFNNFFETRPSNRHVESKLRLRYRQRIWREWLTLEVHRNSPCRATPTTRRRLESCSA